MTEQKKSAHPILEPLDYEITPESMAELLNENQFDVYELLWNSGVATAMDGPALRKEHFTLQLNDADDSEKKTLSVKAMRISCVEKGWGELLPSEMYRDVLTKTVFDSLFPRILEEAINAIDDPFIDANGYRKLSQNQCEELTLLFQNNISWKAKAVEFKNYKPSIDKVIDEMAANGIGRPSTYAARFMAALDNNLISHQDNILDVGQYGKEILNSFATLPHESIINSKFNSELESDLASIENDHTLAGSVLAKYTERALNCSTNLCNWLDELIIDGESFMESLAQSDANIPDANSWDLFALPSPLSPEILANNSDEAKELRKKLDSSLSKTNLFSWQKLSARKRSIFRLIAFTKNNPKFNVKDIQKEASQNLVLRWWIDLGPFEAPIDDSEIQTTKDMIESLGCDIRSEIESISKQINDSL